MWITTERGKSSGLLEEDFRTLVLSFPRGLIEKKLIYDIFFTTNYLVYIGFLICLLSVILTNHSLFQMSDEL